MNKFTAGKRRKNGNVRKMKRERSHFFLKPVFMEKDEYEFTKGKQVIKGQLIRKYLE